MIYLQTQLSRMSMITSLRVLLCLQSVLTSFKSILKVDNECKLKEIFFACFKSNLMHKDNKERKVSRENAN